MVAQSKLIKTEPGSDVASARARRPASLASSQGADSDADGWSQDETRAAEEGRAAGAEAGGVSKPPRRGKLVVYVCGVCQKASQDAR